MSFGICKQSVCLDDILKKVNEVDILNHYLGISTFPTLINSPFREDKNASMSIFINNNNQIIFKDFGTYQSYNLWSFLCAYFKLNYNDLMVKISKDIDNMSTSVYKINTIKNRATFVGKSKIQCKVRQWKDYDLEFWNQFGISKKWLKFGDVYPISHIFITKNDVTYTFPTEKYAYAYVERKDEKVTLKIYQPKSKTRKWMNSSDASVWDLWTKLPTYGDRLFITSSRKDALCLWANTSIPAVSMQGEGYIPKKKVIDELKSRFKRIYIFFDNDFQSDVNNGRKYAQELSREFNLPMIEIPEEYKSKDPSDLYKNHGKEIFKKVIFSLLNEE